MTAALQKLGLALAAALVGVGVVELGLRVADIEYPTFYRVDLDVGSTHRPAFVVVGARKVRARSPSTAKGNETIGNTRTRSRPTPSASRCSEIRTPRHSGAGGEGLLACNGRRTRELSGGVPSADRGHQFRGLGLRHRAGAPHLAAQGVEILPGFRAPCVLHRKRPSRTSRELSGNPLRPYFLLRDGKLVLDDSYRQLPGVALRRGLLGRTYYAVVNHVRVVQLVNELRLRLKAPEASRAPRGRAVTPPRPGSTTVSISAEGAGLGRRLGGHGRPAGRGRRRGLGTQRPTARLHSQQRHSGPPRSEGPGADYARRLGVADLDYPDRRVKSVAGEVGFPVLNLVYPLRAQAEATGTFLHGFKNIIPGTGHWNEHGHAIAGKLMAAELCRILERRR